MANSLTPAVKAGDHVLVESHAGIELKMGKKLPSLEQQIFLQCRVREERGKRKMAKDIKFSSDARSVVRGVDVLAAVEVTLGPLRSQCGS